MEREATAVIRLDGVEVRIGGRAILGPVDLRVERGECWVAMGANGSGKTTLLSVLGARRHPSRGRAEVLGRELGGTDVRHLHTRIGHASNALAERIPGGMLVVDVVLSGRDAGLVTWLRTFDARDHERATELLEDVGCAELADRPIESCSQGERQRVLLARALYARPELLLMDEAAAGLDLPAREHLVRSLEIALARTDAPTLVMATHHLEEIPPSATHALLLRHGKEVAGGPIETTLTSATLGATFGLPLEVARRNGRWWGAATA